MEHISASWSLSASVLTQTEWGTLKMTSLENRWKYNHQL